jgi:hypothetical protein
MRIRIGAKLPKGTASAVATGDALRLKRPLGS